MKNIYLDTNGEVSTKRKLETRLREREEVKVISFNTTPKLVETIKTKEVHIGEEPAILVDLPSLEEKSEESTERSDDKLKKKKPSK
jgi:hypothetical protein